MLSRALNLATLTLLGCLVAVPAFGQATNLEAGKSPSQIFAGTCNACHKSPRGLLRSVSAGSLPGFLRQHYTTSSEMASLLASFLVSNGAADTRYQAKPGTKDAKQEAKPAAGSAEQLDRFGRRLRPAASPQEAAKPEPTPQQQAAKPDADGLSPQADPGRQGRNAKRPARPGEAPDGAKPAAEGQVPAVATIERGPDGRKLTARQRLGKPARPGGEEPSKLDDVKTDAAKTDAAKEEAAKEEAAKGEVEKDDKPKNESVKDESKSETAKIEAPKESGGEPPTLRPDPVPPVTPAPAAPPAVSASVNVSAPEPAAAPPAPAVTPPPAPVAPSAPPAVTASAPPPPAPVAPAGPPAPPISQ